MLNARTIWNHFKNIQKTGSSKTLKNSLDERSHCDQIIVEIGYELIPLVDKEQGGDLFDRIKLVRRRIEIFFGFLIPSVRVIDNLKGDKSEYIIKINGNEAGRGKLFIGKLMALKPEQDMLQLDDTKSDRTVLNKSCNWISNDEISDYLSRGFIVYDQSAVITSHLLKVIKTNVHDLLSIQEVHNIIALLRTDQPVLADTIFQFYNIIEIFTIFKNLLKEKFSIKNPLKIFEVMLEKTLKQPEQISEVIKEIESKGWAKQVID